MLKKSIQTFSARFADWMEAGAERLAEVLAAELRTSGVRTSPSETRFFLANFAPHSTTTVAAHA